MSTEKTRPYQMRVTEEWLATIDDWRRQQPDLPPRAEAIRRLVEIGLRDGVQILDAIPTEKGAP
ncbi:hypothetical protein [Novosphingobium sp.]|uniref:hypothetical protein n=1 Tax=Novosphingobium sp. TaxID=1874826 RepID=UPI00261D86AB|nr:hypothetical protein [Novosphingobium sp.]